MSGRVIAVRFDCGTMAENLGDEEPVAGPLLSACDLGAGDRGPIIGARTAGVARSERQDAPVRTAGQVAYRAGSEADLRSHLPQPLGEVV